VTVPLQSRFAILGGTGRLGATLVRSWGTTHQVISLPRSIVDLEKPDELESALEPYQFDVLINSAGLTDVDRCEKETALAHRMNAESPVELAKICRSRAARFVHIGTDYVFSGTGQAPLTEEDPAVPANQYGRSKLAGDLGVLEVNPAALVARISWLFGPEKPAFPEMILKQALAGSRVSAVADKWSSPTYAPDVASWLLALLGQEHQSGLFHLSNAGACSWQEYGQTVVDAALDAGWPLRATLVDPIPMDSIKAFVAKRPVYTVMNTARFTNATGIVPRSWQDAVREHVAGKPVPARDDSV